MMKNKFKLYGIIVLVAIIGLSMVACNVGTSPIGNDDPRSSGAPAPTGGDGFVIYDRADGGWKVPGISGSFSETSSGLQGMTAGNQGVFVVKFGTPLQVSSTSLQYSKITITLNANSDWAGGEIATDDSSLGTATSPQTSPPTYHVDDYSTNWRITGQPTVEIPLATMLTGIGNYKCMASFKAQIAVAGTATTPPKITKIVLE